MTTILGVVANFTAGGRTSAAVTAVLAGAADRGATTSLLEVDGSDLDAAVEAIAAADGVVFGSPTYRASSSSVMQQLLERLERGKFGDTTAPLRGTAAAIVQTGSSFHHYLAPENLRGVLSSFFAAQVLSPSLYLEGGSFDEHKQLTAEAAATASQHGAALAELTEALVASTALKALEPLI